MKQVWTQIAALGMSLALAQGARAALVDAGMFGGQDCGGAGGFSACKASTTGAHQGGAGSSVIYKRESDGDQDFGSFVTVNGGEFTLAFNGYTHLLSWTYTPGVGDPEIHYFDIKQGNSYRLYYDLANPITRFSIDLDNIGYNAFSHVAWYGGAPASGGGAEVSEPAALALLGAGLLALGFAARRRGMQRAVLGPVRA
ncbi:MAG: PEP-CTERM sorting domain-containing protein [Alphaproteobacteria bacterium]|nr:PEP-CTERM sorting domain-containing protein [Alphaproteobacteria bacterium]